MDKRIQNGSMTNRIIGLDFDGGLHIYRNTAIMGEVKLPALVAPSGIASERRNRLAARLNRECAETGVRFTVGRNDAADSTIHIGQTTAFNAFGRFSGLAEGIGSGNAFVLLDDSASDDELLDIIRHEAGHLLGTLDHGGAGLVRYASTKEWYYWDKDPSDVVIGSSWNGYHFWTRTIHNNYTNSTFLEDEQDQIYLSYHDNETEIIYTYKERDVWENHPTYYDSSEDNTIENYSFASGRTANRIYVEGGTATNCMADSLTVCASYDFDFYTDADRYTYYNEVMWGSPNVPDSLKHNYVIHPGSAIACTATTLRVYGGGTAANCTSQYLTVTCDEIGVDATYQILQGLAQGCTLRPIGDNWSSVSLNVGYGARADSITIEEGGALVGWHTGYDMAEWEEAFEKFGYAEASDLTVKHGSIDVAKGGKLTGATIDGSLNAREGAVLSGNITCTSASIIGADVQTTITVKVDLLDYAYAMASQWVDAYTYVYYYVNYTTKTIRYDNTLGGYNPNNTVLSVSWGTFDNKKEGFQMPDWSHSFHTSILLELDEKSASHVVLDFGGTEKYFSKGSFTFVYPYKRSNALDEIADQWGEVPLMSYPLPFSIRTDKSKWTVSDHERDDGVLYHELHYDASRSGETAEVLWLEHGEVADYTITLDPIMNSASTDAPAVIPYEDAQLKGATLTVKGDKVDDGTVTVKAQDSQSRQLSCELELLVVPETLPILGKKGAGATAKLLKTAQKEHLTTITAALPCDPELNLYSMKFKLSDLSASITVNWTQPSITLKLQGKFEWTFGKESKTLTVDLSGDNYFSVTHAGKENTWDIVGQITVPDFKIGRFGFSGVYLTVNKGESSFGAGGEVTLPGVGISLIGDFSIVNGYIDSVGLGVGNLNTPLGATGLMLQSIYGSISGIATSVNLTFGGKLGLSYGPVVEIEWGLDWLGLEDGEYSLCTLDLEATISTSGEIMGTATVDCLGGFISGSATVKGTSGGPVSLSGTFSMLKEAITIEGVMTSNVGAVTISGKGRMQVPKSDYFGMLGGMGLSVTAFADFGTDNTPMSKRYVMAWEEVTVFGNKFVVGVKCTFDGKVDMLGNSDLLGGDNIGRRGVQTRNGNTSQSIIIDTINTTLFQVNFTTDATVSLVYGEMEYTQAAIAAGQYGNMQIVDELSHETCITIAVANADIGEWTINAYGDVEATFGAYTIENNTASVTLTAVELGGDARSATIRYTLGDLSALENAVVSIYRNGNVSEYTGAKIAAFAANAATGVFDYNLPAELAGGAYAFYLMVTSDNFAPVYSEMSNILKFRMLDIDSPDQIQRVTAKWTSTGTILSWEVPYDNIGVAGYKVAYRASEDDDWSETDTTTPLFAFDDIPNGTYIYRVAAYDAEGNLGAWSVEENVFVNAVANATYRDAVIDNDLTLTAYESAVNIDATGATLRAAANTLVSRSTLGDAEVGGILEASTLNGNTTLLKNGEVADAKVNGNFTVLGTANGIIVADGGALTIGQGGSATNISVKAGGSLFLLDGAEYDDISIAYDAALTIPGNGIYHLAGDIYTASSLNNYRAINGNGHAIHFELYKQEDELVKDGNTYYDQTALVSDMSKFVGDALDIIIDTNSFGEFKIADKTGNFSGNLRVTDYDTGESSFLDLDVETVLGGARCTLHDLYGELWLSVVDPYGFDLEDILISYDSGRYDTYLDLDGRRIKNLIVGRSGSVYGNGYVEGLTVNISGTFSGGDAIVVNAVVNHGTYDLGANGHVTNLLVKNGTVTLGNGTVVGAVVESGGTLSLSSASQNPTLTGGIVLQGSLNLPSNHPGLETDATFVFDLAGRKANSWRTFINNLGSLAGTPTYVLQTTERPETGYYCLTSLSANNPLFQSVSFSLFTAGGTKLGEMQIDCGTIHNNGYRYFVYSDGNDIMLDVSRSDVAPEIAAQTQEWYGAEGTYVVEYSADGFQTAVRVSVDSDALDSFAMPGGDYEWRVRPQNGGDWTAAQSIVVEGDNDGTPKFVQSNADGVADVFFAKSRGVWGHGLQAEHLGAFGGWEGTGEGVVLNGRNKLCDFFEGSSDANVLLMTDDSNGDALFVDDIYSALPDGLEAQSRIAKINEIRAGAGDDIVDLTSQDFAYIGGGVTVRGGMGGDVIWANKGDNWLFGDAGNDRIVGASGNDVIVGGAGNDSLHGGGGNDIFAFGGAWGNDSVEQLAGGKVTLWFKDGDESKWDESTLTYNDGGNSVKVTGVASKNVSLMFGDDDSGKYASLLSAGAFEEFTSEKIFEDRNKGMLA